MEGDICKIVYSTRGQEKIVAGGYLFYQEKNNNVTYYWCCEYRALRGCKGRAVTTLEGNNHILKKISGHNHSPDASRVDVTQALNEIKEKASESREKPSQIIQDAIVNMPEESFSYMPSNEALRKQISRVRQKNMPSQPQSLDDIDVPTWLHTTIRGERFLAKEIDFNNEKIMIFCTISNIQHLEESRYWIMDGTFRTVPTLFYQMYTIHALVGGESNSRVFPMVYVLMTNKLERSYTQLFQELINLGEEAGYDLNPPLIITDFEPSVINSIRVNFPNSNHKCCFFHLCQNLWKRIQSEGLANEYGNNENFSIKLRHLTALAFLPASEIPAAFDQVKLLIPPNANAVIEYFEKTYIRGRVRQQLRNGSTIYAPPLFSPSLWSIYNQVTQGYPRTQNFIEGWHNRWSNIVGRPHVGVYTIIEEMRKEQHQTDMLIEKVLRGEPRPPQTRRIINYERRILSVFNSRNDYSLIDYLRGIAHNISL
jgi:hypothetical protein